MWFTRDSTTATTSELTKKILPRVSNSYTYTNGSPICYSGSFGILPDIYSDILLTSYQAFYPTWCWHSSWQSMWHLAFAIEIPPVAPEIWFPQLRSDQDLALAAEVRQCPLRSGTRGWDLAVPTELRTVEGIVRGCRRRRRKGGGGNNFDKV